MTIKSHRARTCVLVLGNYRPTLPLARSLAEAGLRVIATRGCGRGTSQYSRFVAEVWDHPKLDTGEAFYKALGAFLRSRPDIEIVYPIWEECLQQLDKHKTLLPQDRLYVTCEPETVAHCLNKREMLETVTSLGIPCAPYHKVSSYAALLRSVDEIGYPIVIRPISSKTAITDKKALIVESSAALIAALPRWPAEHRELLVQSYVSGPRINLYFAAQHGRAIRYLPAEILKTDKRDGSGLATDGQTIELDKSLERYADSLLAYLNYHGIGCIQFMRESRTGALSFLELNPRIAGNHAVPELCGMELGRLGLELARGTPQPPNCVVGPAGKRYVWTLGALGGHYRALRSKDIGWPRFLSDCTTALWIGLQADIHMTWAWDDPRPTFALVTRKISGRRGASRRSERSGAGRTAREGSLHDGGG